MTKIKLIILAASIIFALGSCTKEAPNQAGNNPFYVPGGGTGDPNIDPDPEPTDPIGSVPLTFTKKIIIEKMTGEWCGACPSGGTKIEAIATANNGRVFPASFHMSGSDPFEIPEALVWRQHLTSGTSVSSFGFPAASVNRAECMSTRYPGAALDQSIGTDWATQANAQLGKAADCGLALVTEVVDDKVNIDVYVGYNAAITKPNTRVTVYLLENNVPESSVGEQAGAADGYLHKHMIRDVLTADLGDEIDLSTVSATNYAKLELKGLDISGKYLNKENLSILAFVNIKGTKGSELDVLNAQEVKLGETKLFD